LTERTDRKLIVVADDLDDIRLLVSTCLSDAGYEVMSAFDGEQALELILEHQPELAILDVMMPHFDGFEALEVLRAEEPPLATRVLILTAFAVHSDFARGGRGEKADEYLLKPFATDELLTRVRRLIGGPPAAVPVPH
jgi:DNA-binding response OmpR family regulator